MTLLQNKKNNQYFQSASEYTWNLEIFDLFIKKRFYETPFRKVNFKIKNFEIRPLNRMCMSSTCFERADFSKISDVSRVFYVAY